ncbi:Protein kinase, putative [Hondaea fermentalgiana]|uniref:Protein kinase, putative n=1 Tax=Hondaea fermentalgiana TaxID=2315210 RepID=A0A2R5GYJ8_9STRA|nr:Protein kinase, putative [Hondaea fermentalgiana]|eukprot:GBG34888.1 Protein kinase, putative [Hondaea fermentalgiana]
MLYRVEPERVVDDGRATDKVVSNTCLVAAQARGVCISKEPEGVLHVVLCRDPAGSGPRRPGPRKLRTRASEDLDAQGHVDNVAVLLRESDHNDDVENAGDPANLGDPENRTGPAPKTHTRARSLSGPRQLIETHNNNNDNNNNNHEHALFDLSQVQVGGSFDEDLGLYGDDEDHDEDEVVEASPQPDQPKAPSPQPPFKIPPRMQRQASAPESMDLSYESLSPRSPRQPHMLRTMSGKLPSAHLHQGSIGASRSAHRKSSPSPRGGDRRTRVASQQLLMHQSQTILPRCEMTRARTRSGQLNVSFSRNTNSSKNTGSYETATPPSLSPRTGSSHEGRASFVSLSSPRSDRRETSVNSSYESQNSAADPKEWKKPVLKRAQPSIPRLRTESIGSSAGMDNNETFRMESLDFLRSPSLARTRRFRRPAEGRSASQVLPVCSKPGSPTGGGNPFGTDAAFRQHQSQQQARKLASQSELNTMARPVHTRTSRRRKTDFELPQHRASQSMSDLLRMNPTPGQGGGGLVRTSSFRTGRTLKSPDGTNSPRASLLAGAVFSSSKSDVQNNHHQQQQQQQNRRNFLYMGVDVRSGDDVESSAEAELAFGSSASSSGYSPRRGSGVRRHSRVLSGSISPTFQMDGLQPPPRTRGPNVSPSPPSNDPPLTRLPTRLRSYGSSSTQRSQVAGGGESREPSLYGSRDSTGSHGASGSRSSGAANGGGNGGESVIPSHTPRHGRSSAKSGGVESPSGRTVSFADGATQVSSRRVPWSKESFLGGGTFGKVFSARDLETGTRFAVKIIAKMKDATDAEAAKIRTEIDIMKDLRHPNIVGYLGSQIDPDSGALEIFLQLVDGGSLQHFYDTHGALSKNLLPRLTLHMTRGLDYLHSKGIIHRDIKAANVLLSDSGVAMLADFGTSKQLDLLDSTDHTLQEVRGSVPWMSPEVVRQEGATLASDIWSLGCTVLECCAAKAPWKFKGQFAGIWAIGMTTTPPPFPENIEEDTPLHEFLMLCLAINPLDRPRTTDLLAHQFLTVVPSCADEASG